jgi:anti-anti-sigma factor
MNSELQTVTLPSAMDITTVQHWTEKLLKQLDNQKSMVMDGSSVEKKSSAGIQLMVSVNRKIEQDMNHLIVENPSHAMTEAFRDFGLLELLQKWSKAL